MATGGRADLAHLSRRAGFGATPAELDVWAAKGYEAVVEELLNPEEAPEFEADLMDRYFRGEPILMAAGEWVFRMANSPRPLEEKIALFWHHVFATGYSKGEHPPAMVSQIEMFRRVGLSDMRTILIELSKDPAMIYWLDNNENRRDEPNENYGRELLELFSMGVGSYSEQDIKMAARAFTGWTFTQPLPVYPNGHHVPDFLYRGDDHDDSVKTFLDEEGRFNGEDIVDIIVGQEATARFVCRHLYNFFVADEPQVPAWGTTPPRNPDAVDALVEAYFNTGGDIRSILRALFNSDFFKAARFKRVKCPAELVAGAVKVAGTYRFPRPEILDLDTVTTLMGQQLYNPPTVEGWHTGREWIDGGALNERVDFAVKELADPSVPGVREIVGGLSERGGPLSPEELVEESLDAVGSLDVSPETRAALLDAANAGGELRFGSDEERGRSAASVSRMLQLIAASPEYQLA